MLHYSAVIKMKDKLQGSALLLLTTLIWGSSFVAQSVGMDYIGPITFQTIRCALAFVGLLPVIWLFDLKKKDGKNFITRFFDKKLLIAGVCCGIPLFLASTLQQIGLVYTDAGKAAFLTSMYIVFIPIFGLFFKRKLTPIVPISVGIAVVGLYCLSCVGVSQIATGDWILIGCGIAYAIQITLVGELASDVDAIRLNCIQALICSVINAVIMLFTETPTVAGITGSIWPLCYSGFLSMGVAFSLQIMGQKKLETTPASLIMSLESVFAAIFGMLFLNEVMTFWEALGCVLMFTAVILSQIPFPQKKKQIAKQ